MPIAPPAWWPSKAILGAAAVAASVTFGVAGEVAALAARGPGSFATAIIDALHRLDGATLGPRAKVT